MSSYVRLIVFILFMAYWVLCAIVFFYQRAMIYHPTPLLVGAEAAKLTTLAVDGASLKLSVREVAGDEAIIYFGGNAEAVSQSLPKYAEAFPNHAIYMLHYRGYSGSSGKPTEIALHSDAEKLYAFVKEKHKNITLIGRSLGTGVAIRVAGNHEVIKLVLVTPYDSILNLAKLRFPYLPVSMMLKDRFESWKYAPKINVPTVILAAENDKVIPMKSTRALYAAFNAGIAKLKVIEKVDHIMISHSPNYFAAMRYD